MAGRTEQPSLVRLSDTDFRLEAPEQDTRGLDVYDRDGDQIGSVKDLYVDEAERKVRFLNISGGGFLGIGEKHFLVPMEYVTEVGEVRITIEPGREKTTATPPFDTRVVPLNISHHRDVYNHYGHTNPSRINAPRDPYSGGT